MKQIIAKSWVPGLFTLALSLALAGCSKESEAGGEHAGHRHGSEAKADVKAAKCARHQLPKEECFICDAALREPGRLWCKEHELYEDECFLCHPEVKKKAGAPSASNGSSGEVLMCKEHGVPEAQCGICRPEVAGKLKAGEGMMVRLPSLESAKLAGVETALPTAGSIAGGVECYAEIAFNQNKLAQLAAPVGGIIQEVAADLGNQVQEKQVVAKIWSAMIAEAVAKAVLTHQTLERERKLRAQRVTAEKDLQEAEAAHRAACQQARTLGFSEEQVDAFRARPEEPVMLEVRAPFAGEIVERNAVRGALVEAGKSLFTVTDRSVMWAMLNITETAMGRVQVGQEVELQVDSLPGRVFKGKLTWVGPEVDERSRMGRARAEVENPGGVLKARMFARARIVTGQPVQAVLVPNGAVERVENRALIFVKSAEDLYEARAVRLGASLNGRYEVLEGLKPEEQVAVKHVFALKSQLLISRLGAGCVDD